VSVSARPGGPCGGWGRLVREGFLRSGGVLWALVLGWERAFLGRMGDRVLIGNPVLSGLTTPAVTRAAHDMLAAGADLVALGRPFLANPDLVDRPRRGAPSIRSGAGT
jgi:hypothetical protein